MSNMNFLQSQDLDDAAFAVYNLNEVLDSIEHAAYSGLFDMEGDTRTHEQIAIDGQNKILHMFNQIGDPKRQIKMLCEQSMRIWLLMMYHYNPVVAH